MPKLDLNDYLLVIFQTFETITHVDIVANLHNKIKATDLKLVAYFIFRHYNNYIVSMYIYVTLLFNNYYRCPCCTITDLNRLFCESKDLLYLLVYKIYNVRCRYYNIGAIVISVKRRLTLNAMVVGSVGEISLFSFPSSGMTMCIESFVIHNVCAQELQEIGVEIFHFLT